MLNDLLAALNDCVWAYDVQTQSYLFISPSVHTVLEYSAKDLQQNPNFWNDIIDPRDREEILSAEHKPDTDDWAERTCRVITKCGKVKWIHHKKRHITDSSTGHDVQLNIIRDVSDPKFISFKLQDSIGDFNVLFNDNPTPMWIYELPTLRILKVNAASVQQYGYSEQEFLGMTIRDIRPRFDLAKFNEYLYQKGIPESRLDGFNNGGVWRHVNKAGEILYAEITGHEIKYDNHSCRVIIATNVTEKVLQQEEMKKREKFLTSLIDSQTNFLLRIDTSGNFTFANNQFLKALSYKKQEIVGKHFSLITPADEIGMCEQALMNCIKSPGKVIHLQHHKIDKAGNLHLTKWEFISITNEEGIVTDIQGIGQDLTEKGEIEEQAKKVSEEIAWTKNNLEALINNTGDYIWSIDRQGKYVYMNSAYRNRIIDTMGTEPKEGDDAYAHSGNTGKILDEWRGYYNRALSGERYVTRHQSPNPGSKEITFFEVSFNPIYRKSKNEIVGVGCFARDITERLKTEEALIEQNERLKNIASLSSHELRRPVASMLGLLNIIDKENFANPENLQIIEHLDTVGNEIDEVIRLIVNKTFIDSKYPL